MSKLYYFDVFETAIGRLTVITDETGAVTEVWSSDAGEVLSKKTDHSQDSARTSAARVQLTEYAEGKRRNFDLALAAQGSPFQYKVWEQLQLIPYGATKSYGEIAAILGVPNASRAVGRANATNPIAIVVPCHRVIGSSGALTGYAGGLPMKRRLLELEGVLIPPLFSK